MAKQRMSAAGLSSRARAGKRADDGINLTLRPIHQAILKVREDLMTSAPSDEVGKERVIAAIRNLDIARVALECNQSLSPLDYNVEPWKQLKSMDQLLKNGGVKKSAAKKR